LLQEVSSKFPKSEQQRITDIDLEMFQSVFFYILARLGLSKKNQADQ